LVHPTTPIALYLRSSAFICGSRFANSEAKPTDPKWQRGLNRPSGGSPETRAPGMSVTQEQAVQIARDHLRREGIPWNVPDAESVHDLDALQAGGFQPPVVPGVDLSHCWIVYCQTGRKRLFPSSIVVVSKPTGGVLYTGSANDRS
jgi:hypothetical protein